MPNNNLNKLMIGTAQWGMAYGAYNRVGQSSMFEIRNMLEFMREKHITDIDTSSLYGEAHNVLEELKIENFKIYTKIKLDISLLKNDATATPFERIAKTQKFWGVSIHNAEIIHNDNFQDAVEYMYKIQQDYGIKQIGISIYDVEALERLYKFWTPDIIQIPLNFFNNKFLKSGALDFIKTQGTQIHARSLFCQGLLLQDLDSLSIEDKSDINVVKDYVHWCKDSGLTQLEACLALAKSTPLIDKIILGFDDFEQLIQAFETYERAPALRDIPNFHARPELYDPRFW